MPLQKLENALKKQSGTWIAITFLVLACLTSWWSLHEIRQQALKAAADSLQAVNRSVATYLTRQSHEMSAAAASIVVNMPYAELLQRALQPEATRADRFALLQVMAPWFVSNGYRDFYLLHANGEIVAGMREGDVGAKIPKELKQTLKQVSHDEPLLSHPIEVNGKPQEWLMIPLPHAQGVVGSILAVVLHPDLHLGEMMDVGVRFGESSETYLVDRSGYLLSRSRFEAQLRRMGLLADGQSSVLHIRSENPDTHQQTEAFEHALQNPDGQNTEGYLDYRGERVIGVWQWSKTLDAAVISEVNLDEALAGFYYTRNLLVLLLAGLLLAGFVIAHRYAHYRRELERQDNALRNLLIESTAEAIYGVDLKGNCTFANQSCLRMLGYERVNQLLGKNMHQLVHHSHADGSPYDEKVSLIFRSFRNKTRVHCRGEVLWRVDGSSFPAEFWAHPLFEEDGSIQGGVVTFWDISALRQAEAERRDIEKQLQHTQRLESLGVLAGGIAHDFNNILAAILGHAELAHCKLSLTPLDAEINLERITQSCDRAASLCRQMLAYSGKGRFVVSALNLSTMIDEITHLLEVTLDKKVSLHYALTDPLPLVDADEAQMQQLMMNLVTNANEAIGDKEGEIRIATGVADVSEAELLHCFGDSPKAGLYVYVQVSDTGCGMDEATKQKIFDPFFTTKFTGRGLGMSAVLGIIRGHQGALCIDSVLGQGTNFRFLIPALEQASGVTTRGAEVSKPWRSYGHVLVVDDELSVRETTVMLLEHLGFETFTAIHGEDALRVYQQHAEEIDLVLMDLTMPKMGGEACWHALVRINPKVKVVLTSGYNQDDLKRTFADSRLAGFIQKPVSMARLKHAMREAMQQPKGGDHA